MGRLIELNGCFQSRNYKKVLDCGTAIDKIAYEVSAHNIKLL